MALFVVQLAQDRFWNVSGVDPQAMMMEGGLVLVSFAALPGASQSATTPGNGCVVAVEVGLTKVVEVVATVAAVVVVFRLATGGLPQLVIKIANQAAVIPTSTHLRTEAIISYQARPVTTGEPRPEGWSHLGGIAGGRLGWAIGLAWTGGGDRIIRP